QHFTWVDLCHSILVPDHLAAGSRSYDSRLGCPHQEEATLCRELCTSPLPETHISVGYCWQNSRCCQFAPRKAAQLHRRLRVAPERLRSLAGPAARNVTHRKTVTAARSSAMSWFGAALHHRSDCPLLTLRYEIRLGCHNSATGRAK